MPRDVCEHTPRIELSYLRRRGLLAPGKRTMLSWSCGGRTAGSIGLTVTDQGLTLQFQVINGEGRTWPVSELVPFAWSATNFGGARLWLTCPRCHRRAGVLYGCPHFRCRVCNRLSYQSQRLSSPQRAGHQADKLVKRVIGLGGVRGEDDFPAKPRSMRWLRYNQLQDRYDELMDAWTVGIIHKYF
jgi:hypothetical protein